MERTIESDAESLNDYIQYYCTVLKLWHCDSDWCVRNNSHILSSFTNGVKVFSSQWIIENVRDCGKDPEKLSKKMLHHLFMASPDVQRCFINKILCTSRNPIFVDIQHENLCLCHTLNNLLQMRAFTSVDNSNNVVDDCVNLYAVARRHAHGPNGDYAHEAIEPLCSFAGLGCCMLPIGVAASVRVTEETLNRCLNIITRFDNAIGYVLCTPNHFITLTRNASQSSTEHEFVIIDSFIENPPVFMSTSNMVSGFLTLCRSLRCFTSLYIIFIKENSPVTADYVPSMALQNPKCTGHELEAFVKKMWDNK